MAICRGLSIIRFPLSFLLPKEPVGMCLIGFYGSDALPVTQLTVSKQ